MQIECKTIINDYLLLTTTTTTTKKKLIHKLYNVNPIPTNQAYANNS